MPRLQIDVSEQQLEDIERLMAKCGASTKRELFNNAFVLLDWAVRERERGNVIASSDEAREKYRELQMPILSNVRVAGEETERAVTAGGKSAPVHS